MIKAIRGATTLDLNTEEEIKIKTVELIEDILKENSLSVNDLVSVIFSVTEDITNANPARFFRENFSGDIPLFCVQEAKMEKNLPLCIRVIIHCQKEGAVKHSYLQNARSLRPDLTEDKNKCELSFTKEKAKIDFGTDKCTEDKIQSYNLVRKKGNNDSTKISVGEVTFGQDKVVIAGPCAVESLEQMDIIASFLKAQGVNVLRGGAYKPRTSPYSFQGLKEEGLSILEKIGKKYSMVTVTEAVSLEALELVAKYSDIIQIGARNMTNFELLKALGHYPNPVILKRGMASTIQEFLTAAEYIVVNGNNKVILCERGIRTFETYTRNTMDLSAIASIKQLSHLPIIADPSHGTGRWSLVTPMAKASLACGADGIMVEVHNEPQLALSDGDQSLNFAKFQVLMREINPFLK